MNTFLPKVSFERHVQVLIGVKNPANNCVQSDLQGAPKLSLVQLPVVVSVPTWRPKDGNSQIKPMLLKCFQGNVAAKC